MLLEAAFPPLPMLVEALPPFSESAEKPEPPQCCRVGFGTNKPCFAKCSEVLWNADIGYWYRAPRKRSANL